MLSLATKPIDATVNNSWLKPNIKQWVHNGTGLAKQRMLDVWSRWGLVDESPSLYIPSTTYQLSKGASHNDGYLRKGFNV